MEIVHEPAAKRQEAECRQGPSILTQRKPVGGDLFDQEPIERQVVIKRADDVIAVGVGPVEVRILEEDIAPGIGIASDVEPVARPSFSIMR